MRTKTRRNALVATLLVGASMSVSCVDEKIVFQDRQLFEDPLDAAASFLGYTDHDSYYGGFRPAELQQKETRVIFKIQPTRVNARG